MIGGEFSPEMHYNSKMKNRTVRDQGIVISLKKQPSNSSKEVRIEIKKKGIRRVMEDKYTYDRAVDLKAEHTKYIAKLLGNVHPEAAMALLYQAELTGAEIKINNSVGIIIEERKNSLIVIFKDNKVRCFPKSTNSFIFSFNGTDYLFIAKNLKKNRIFKGQSRAS